MTSLKGGVTNWFSRRTVVAKTLKSNDIDSEADFLELAVLADLVDGSNSWQPKNLSIVRAEQHYLVACSPTTNWLHGSRFEAVSRSGDRYALRTGISVKLSDGSTSEIDVLIVSLANVLPTATQITAADLVAGLECKAFDKRLQMPTIDAVIGKACRVWGTPVPTVMKVTERRFCLCCLLDVAANAKLALATASIDLLEGMASNQTPSKTRAKALCTALGL